MKKLILTSLSILTLVTICVLCVFAQDTSIIIPVIDTIVADTIIPVPTPGPLPALTDWFNLGMIPLMAALNILFGYVGKWVPLFNKIQDTTLRVLAFAVLVGAGFIWYGGDIWEVAAAYFGSSLMYDKIFKQIFGGSPKVDGTPREPSALVP